MKSKRKGKVPNINWTPEEERTLAHAWVNILEDLKISNDKNNKIFRKELSNVFPLKRFKESTGQRFKFTIDEDKQMVIEFKGLLNTLKYNEISVRMTQSYKINLFMMFKSPKLLVLKGYFIMFKSPKLLV